MTDDVTFFWVLVGRMRLIPQAGIYNECEELNRDVYTYLQDQWNYLDVLTFVMLLGGFLSRIVDSDSMWGRSMYALSAPPLFSRVLFFAQMLRFQGPMIQVGISPECIRNWVTIDLVIDKCYLDVACSTEAQYTNVNKL